MRKQMVLVGAVAGLTVLAASAASATVWHRDRWYADYLFGCCHAGPVYGPPVVYVVPPAYAYYPRPLYRVGCCGTIYGPRGSYYTAYYSRYGYQGYRGYPDRRW
jgi:hypothetical protein